jgi:hypothetical protein
MSSLRNEVKSRVKLIDLIINKLNRKLVLVEEEATRDLMTIANQLNLPANDIRIISYGSLLVAKRSKLLKDKIEKLTDLQNKLKIILEVTA